MILRMANDENLQKRLAKLRKILAEDYGIYTDEEFFQAYQEMKTLDIGIFTCPIQRDGEAML